MRSLIPVVFSLTALLSSSISGAAPTAEPVGNNNNKRDCEPILPSTIIHLVERYPDHPFSDTRYTQSGDADAGNHVYDNQKTAMKFRIGPGKTGCRLHVQNPALTPQNSHGQIDTKIWMVEDVNRDMTWNNPPTIVDDAEGLPTQWNWLGGPTNVWSHAGACPEELSFLFEYNDDWQTQGGWLYFDQRVEWGSSMDGWSIVYDNCT